MRMSIDRFLCVILFLGTVKFLQSIVFFFFVFFLFLFTSGANHRPPIELNMKIDVENKNYNKKKT